MRIHQLLIIVAVFGTSVPFGFTQDSSSFRTLYSFTGGPDGGNPQANVVIGQNGALYGTTSHGGASNAGTVFKLAPPATPGAAWTETVLYNYATAPFDHDETGVVIGSGGVLYGSETGNCPTDSQSSDDPLISVVAGFRVFQLTPPASPGGAWTETCIGTALSYYQYAFPPPPVVIGKNGVLYGTTVYGTAPYNNFYVVSLTPPASSGGAWTETFVHNFGNIVGAAALVTGHKGVLYGTTRYPGTVFKLAPPASQGGAWTETLLYSFTGGNDGSYSQASIVVGSGGVLYGTTPDGGASNAGTVFKLAPPTSPGGAWTETVLYSFQGGSDGADPVAPLVIDTNGVLYGTTPAGGISNAGTVFSLTPPATPGGAWTETVLHSFTGGPGGYAPRAGLAIGGGGLLYGTTSGGGTSHAGTVFVLRP